MSGNHRCIGLLREAKSKWERRAALTPEAVKQLVAKNIRVLVQPSTRRVFANREYEQAGATITEDLSAANCIFSVKEFPKLTEKDRGRAFMLFSHVIKAQKQNMPFLDAAMRHGIRLFDYEAVRAKKADGGQRLVAFGKFAGLAGMIDSLRGVGERLLSLGYSSPFMGVSSSYSYPSVTAAKTAVTDLGREIKRVGLHESLAPLVFTFTGSGNVSQGAREIFELLPHSYVDPADLPHLPKDPFRVFGTVASAQHMVRAVRSGGAGGGEDRPFDKADYYANPQNYEPVFHRNVIPHTSVLINGMYWDPRFPRLLTSEQMRELHRIQPNKLLLVGDISCDIEGSVEFLKTSTTIDAPFFVWDPVSDTIANNTLAGDGVAMMGVDNLPTEFPKEASSHFSSALMPFVEALSIPAPEQPFALQTHYSEELRNSCIVADGKLTPNFEYIQRLRERQERKKDSAPAAASSSSAAAAPTPAAGKYPVQVNLILEGHLFDSGFINQALDLIETHAADFNVVHWDISPNRAERQSNVSKAVIGVSTQSQSQLQTVIDHLNALATRMPMARASVKQLPFSANVATLDAQHLKHTRSADTPSAAPSASTPASSYVAGKPEKSVLVLGSGFVAGPLVEYMARRNAVTVASALLEEAKSIAGGNPNVTAVRLDANDTAGLETAIRSADLVVSFLPATYHPAVAKACIAARKHLVTASYVSPALRALHDSASAAGIAIMNEVGLDPGIDHMSALKVIHEVEEKGGRVFAFESVCGGLPAPEAADNPLGYKFSWNPRGVLTATQNPARFIRSGQTVEISGPNLLSSAKPIELNPAFHLEVLPNRDSLQYANDYKLTGASTLFRGTLRYAGFSAIVDNLTQLGLLSNDRLIDLNTYHYWAALTSSLLSMPAAAPSSVSLESAIRSRLNTLAASTYSRSPSLAQDNIERTISAARWLGLHSAAEPVSASPVAPKTADGRVSVLDAFCHLLERRLAYTGEERDVVILHHTFGIRWPTGQQEKRHSTLISYGGDGGRTGRKGGGGGGGWSAMARTVGIPAAITAQLLLDGGVAARGVLRPMTREVYAPVLDKLKAEGIEFREKSFDIAK